MRRHVHLLAQGVTIAALVVIIFGQRDLLRQIKEDPMPQTDSLEVLVPGQTCLSISWEAQDPETGLCYTVDVKVTFRDDDHPKESAAEFRQRFLDEVAEHMELNPKKE